MTILQHENITLRPFRETDIPQLAKIANNKKIYDNVRDMFPHPYAEENAEKFINGFANSHEKQRIFAIEYEGKLAGAMGIHPRDDIYRKSGEIGYWLGEEFWGKGIATAGVKLLLPYAWKELDLVRIFAGVFAYNKGSARVLEKCGFELEGILKKAVFKNGEIYDEHHYAIVI